MNHTADFGCSNINNVYPSFHFIYLQLLKPIFNSYTVNGFGYFLTTCLFNSVIFARLKMLKYLRNKQDMNNCVMKKLSLAALFITSALLVQAQKDTTVNPNVAANATAPAPVKKEKVWDKIDLSNRPNDHLMIQYGYDSWGSVPDSINTSGFSRHFNVYGMLDKPFKKNPHMSVGFGLGVGSSNIFFTDTYVNLKSPTTTLPFTNVAVSDVNHYKKYKLTTVFAELPIEFRYAGNPVTPDKGFKAAIGVKIGTLLDAHTKGKNAIDRNGSTIYGTKYIVKEKEKHFINTTRAAVTARIGYGNFSLDGSYQFTDFLKQGTGPQIKPYSIGLTISGL